MTGFEFFQRPKLSSNVTVSIKKDKKRFSSCRVRETTIREERHHASEKRFRIWVFIWRERLTSKIWWCESHLLEDSPKISSGSMPARLQATILTASKKSDATTEAGARYRRSTTFQSICCSSGLVTSSVPFSVVMLRLTGTSCHGTPNTATVNYKSGFF